MVIPTIEARTATSGHLRLTPTQTHGSWSSAPLTFTLRVATLSQAAFPSAASPSRALRSLPLSVMMSGTLYWGNGNLNLRGTGGYFWSSTPYTYTHSHSLNFDSSNVGSKYGYDKTRGLSLRCIARFFVLFLPELSAASLFRLCCRAVSTGSVVIPSIEVRAATSGHLRLTPTQIHSTCSSTLLMSALSMAVISHSASPSAASPVLLAFFFQSSPQPSSFGYDVGRSRLEQWSSHQ